MGGVVFPSLAPAPGLLGHSNGDWLSTSSASFNAIRNDTTGPALEYGNTHRLVASDVPIEQTADDASSEGETSPQGFGETNSRTNGKEFYGPAAQTGKGIPCRHYGWWRWD